jgi:hypothetical protein
MKRVTIATLTGVVALVLVAGVILQTAEGQKPPFGSPDDVTFAKNVWGQIKDYQQWPIRTDYMPGRSPHGDIIRTYYSMATVDGAPHHVIVKANYRGNNLTAEEVKASPEKYFSSATVMVQRENGYDPDNNNWFWAKYNADGSLQDNAKGMALAGRVAKGTDQGCIHCHAEAKGDDYFFTNDR